MVLPAVALLAGVFVTLRLLGARYTARYLARQAKLRDEDAASSDERVARFKAQLDASLHDGKAEAEARFDAEVAGPLQKTPRQLWIATAGTPAAARVVASKQTTTMINLQPVVELTLEVPGAEAPTRSSCESSFLS
jgi:hypothetical protein